MAPATLFYCILNIFTIATFTHSAQLPTLRPISIKKEPTVRIQCMTGNMIISIKDPPPNNEGTFSGMVYPKGLSKNSTCLSEFRNHQGILKYKLPLRSCNTMPQETEDGSIEFFNTIVLQPHLKLVTDLGRGYHVRCRYKSREAAAKQQQLQQKSADETIKPNDTVSPQAYSSDESSPDRREHGRSFDLSSSSTSSVSSNENSIPMPGCHMKIFAGDVIAENVKIGDPLKIVINIDKQSVYGLQVTDCLVRDGLGWGEQNLINDDGCPYDGEIMGPFQYSEEYTKATVSFPAHKFPYTASVYYQCNVKLCALLDPDCKKAPSCIGKRIKRDTGNTTDDEGHPATIEVYSGLYVNENAEVVEGDEVVLKEKTPEDAICVSQRNFAIAIAIAGLILMLAVIAAVLIIMSRRHGKTISNSGSSIYSGPYTNTAFSHSS